MLDNKLLFCKTSLLTIHLQWVWSMTFYCVHTFNQELMQCLPSEICNFSVCYQVIVWFWLSLLCTTVHEATLNNGSVNFHNRKNCQVLTQCIFPHYSYSGKYTHWDIRFGRSFNSPPGDLQLCDCSAFIYLFVSQLK